MPGTPTGEARKHDLSPTSAHSEFRGGGKPWGGVMTVMEEWEILVGWVTKVCLKRTKKAGVGREGDI